MFPSLKALRGYLQQTHSLSFCDICLEGRKVRRGLESGRASARLLPPLLPLLLLAARTLRGGRRRGDSRAPSLTPHTHTHPRRLTPAPRCLPTTPPHLPTLHPSLRAQVFVPEQLVYTRPDLERHQRTGDAQGPLAESGFKGHPDCRFCRKRFYSETELYQHMHATHEQCFLCRWVGDWVGEWVRGGCGCVWQHVHMSVFGGGVGVLVGCATEQRTHTSTALLPLQARQPAQARLLSRLRRP